MWCWRFRWNRYIISYPLFADADTGIYPHAASQYHARPKAKRGIAMVSVDKFTYPRKQTRGNEFIPCSNNICDILKRFRSFKFQAITLSWPKSPYKHSVTRSYRSGKRTAVGIAIVTSSMTFLCLYISRWWRQTWDTPPYLTVVNQSEARISTEHGISVYIYHIFLWTHRDEMMYYSRKEGFMLSFQDYFGDCLSLFRTYRIKIHKLNLRAPTHNSKFQFICYYLNTMWLYMIHLNAHLWTKFVAKHARFFQTVSSKQLISTGFSIVPGMNYMKHKQLNYAIRRQPNGFWSRDCVHKSLNFCPIIVFFLDNVLMIEITNCTTL